MVVCIGMNQLIVIRGPLGIGKTTVARRLAEKLDALYVSIDDVLAELSLDRSEGEGIPVGNFIRANEHIVPALKESWAANRPVVVDGNFYHQEQLDHLLSTAASSQVFTLKAPVEVCIARDRDRQKPYGEDAARAVHMMVSRFDAGEVIDAAHLDADQTVAEIVERLKY